MNQFLHGLSGIHPPKKFGIDKRRLHLSTLIVSGQISRSEAVNLLQESPYPEDTQLESDRAFFLKKMRWNSSDLNDYLARPPVPHDYYPSEAWRLIFIKAFRRLFLGQ